ncbi:MAG TPA: amino acid adenylation domain-containing protein [Thermoanaerobaculia bacterium]|nr:amino acid adenylation domain-containing protein [Thermoanaerobaculia bacterium]
MNDLSAQTFRLSTQQRRLWFLEQAGRGCRAQCAVLVEGPLDPPRLEAAVRAVSERHEILRTAFRRRLGMKVPFQVVGAAAEPAWCETDAGGEADLDRLLAAEAARPLDLAAGPALSLCRVALGGERRWLLWTLPALCADARSLENLLREVVAEYAGGEPPEPPLQYADFVEWQSELLAGGGEEAEVERAYWRENGRLAELILRLPLETAGGDLGREEEVALPPLPAAAAAVLARMDGADLPCFLEACWAALLARLTSRQEMVIATVIDGRAASDLADAVGPYASWLPIAARCAPDLPLRALAGELRRALFAAGGRQQSFDWEGSGGAVEAPGLAAAGFEFQRDELELTAAGARFRLLRRRAPVERFTVLFSCVAREELHLALRYDAGRLERAEAERLAGQLTTLLAHALCEPETPLGRLRLLRDEERRQLLSALNPAGVAPPARSFLELFAEQAAREPEATAAVDEAGRISYGELDARSNRLARHLWRLGVGPETVAALFLDRSADVLVAMLGVLKAGGAYAPLEPEQPRRRLELLLATLRPRVVVTEDRLAARLPGDGAIPVVRLDGDAAAIAREDGGRLECGAAAENLMYVVFTSGSTGVPKGVAVEHRQLAGYLAAIGERLGLPGASYATVSTFAADLGHTAIFPALATGGCLHVVSVERATDATAFADYFDRHEVDCLKIVPSHLEALQATSRPERSLPRRRLVLGGEASRWELVERLRALRPDLEILNHYGPSETTVGVITHAVGGREPHAATVPLGAPLAHSRVHLLDPEMEPVPVGVAGELYIGGAGVSRGYLGRPEATAERFVPDPFGTEPGARLYRSGDRARYLPGGAIEFLGRMDNQVKYHGFRVELNEIRTALNRHRQVRDSVVVLRKDRNGRDVLVCYYVSRQELEFGELRAFLAESLLEETLPNAFVHLRRLPLTLNGKVNLEALPSLEEVRQQPRRAFVAPRDATEELVAGIWSEVLGVDRVSVDDNFFELGGHSLLATRVLSRLRDAVTADVTLRHLFEAPTVAELARAIGAAEQVQAGFATAVEAIRAQAAGLDEQLLELERLADDDVHGLLESQA